MSEECNWCGKEEELISHHYPIPSKDKGKETVSICHTCHKAYHYGVLVGAVDCKNEEEIEIEIKKTLHRCFPKIKEI